MLAERIRQRVPWPENAGRIVVWKDKEEIYAEDVPDPPRVKVDEHVEESEGVKLKWHASSATRGTSTHLRYLVQWWDEAKDVWRSVAPRQTKRTAVVPRHLFTRQTLTVRILATSGLATGYTELNLELEHPPKPTIDVLLAGQANGQGTRNRVLHAIAVDRSGRQVSSDLLSWHDTSGAEIGRGAFLDTRTLPEGKQVARAVVRGNDALTAKGWLAEPTAGGLLVHHEILDHEPTEVVEHQHPHPPPKAKAKRRSDH